MPSQGVSSPKKWQPPFHCGGCKRPYPADHFPHSCPHCGALYEFAEDLILNPLEDREGLHRYQTTFPLPPGAPLVSLGEGRTPLISAAIKDREIHFKCEHLNPTGSFKDRGSAILVSALQARGVRRAVEDSSGNAGASFAAYAARAGIQARVFVPDYASGPKMRQMVALGAEVIRVQGPRSAASAAVLTEVEEGAVYASHAYLPHGLAGMATVAYEIHEQLGGAPGSVVTPIGQGSLLLGLYQGFRALEAAGKLRQFPQLIGVQARACAPIWAVYTAGASGLEWMREGKTVAEGIRIIHPLRGDQVIRAVEASGGAVVAVEEEVILAGQAQLSRGGFYVEPTSAVVIPGLMSMWDQARDPVVLVLTGSGFKSAS